LPIQDLKDSKRKKKEVSCHTCDTQRIINEMLDVSEGTVLLDELCEGCISCSMWTPRKGKEQSPVQASEGI